MTARESVEVLLVAWFIWHLSHQAGRLDRLHHRIEVSHAALDGHLARRAAVIAEIGLLIENHDLVHLAHKALTISPNDFDSRSIAENQMLSKLADACSDIDAVSRWRQDEKIGALIEVLKTDNLRVQLSRRFHAEAVRSALHLRDQRLVRWFHLAGRAARPTTLDFADSLPISLGN